MTKHKDLFFKYTISRLKTELERADQRIIAISQILSSLPKNINEIFEELRIIGDILYPNMEKELTLEEYVRLCSLEEISENTLKKISLDKTKIRKILEIQEMGLSAELEKDEKIIFINLAKNLQALLDTKKSLEALEEKMVKTNYPNFSEIATPAIACKMIEVAGSFERLSRFPASTIQLLGAENSFFRALKTRSKKTPKYGFIYAHPLLINLNKKDKGRFARTISAKIAIAIKADLGGKDLRKELTDKINSKLKK
jgi:nucleolar protein 56